jgi:hypothetical protein
MPQEQVINRTAQGWFPKGQSGNPGGRPRGSVSLHNRVKKELLKEKNGEALADTLALRLVEAALENPAKMWPFIRDLIDREEGRPASRVEFSEPENLIELLKALEK